MKITIILSILCISIFCVGDVGVCSGATNMSRQNSVSTLSAQISQDTIALTENRKEFCKLITRIKKIKMDHRTKRNYRAELENIVLQDSGLVSDLIIVLRDTPEGEGQHIFSYVLEAVLGTDRKSVV